MPSTATLRHVSLEVSDVERTSWFYDRFLGEVGFRRFVKDAGYAAYTDGEVTIWLIHERAPRVHRRPPTGEEEVIAEHLAFHVDSPQMVKAIEDRLAKVELYPIFRTEEHPEFRPGYVSATWVDPDQIVLEIYTVPARAAKRRKSKPPRKKARKRRSG
ncbi:MAG TPA: VOC family protein [Thermoplasmata archaeon]|nr:VOC family protein [Thermoplasmata archaeon]